MSSQYILYDLASQFTPNKCWSPNPWKTRMLLNYKTIPYETQWLDYPEIEAKFKQHIPPNETGAAYTIPTVQLPDGSYIQDSKKIAQHIEHEHPDPPMHLESETLKKMGEIMPKLGSALQPEYIPKVYKRILNEASRPHWDKTRGPLFDNKPFDQVEQEMGGDTAWMYAAPHLQAIMKLLTADDSGPFFEGTRVTYVDFVFASWLKFMQTIGDDTFAKALEVSGDREALLAHFKACQPWLERDDH